MSAELVPSLPPALPSSLGTLRRPNTRAAQAHAVFAAGFHYIAKETDRRWEQGEDISIVESKVQEYRPNETARLVSDTDLQHEGQSVSIPVGQKSGRQ